MRAIPRWALLVATGATVTACDIDFNLEPSEKITGFKFQVTEHTLIIGETRALPTAYFVNDFGYFPADTGTQWEIVDTTIARLAEGGKIIAGAMPGTTSLIARNGVRSAAVPLRVITQYFVWPDGMRLIPGATRKAVVHAERLVAGRTIAQPVWESSNPAVATVAEDGTIMAVADGQASIIARRGDFTAATQVQVASYSAALVFTDFGLSPRGTCAKTASSIWCWGEHATPEQSSDRCASLTYPQTSVPCSWSPVLMTMMPFAELVSVRPDSWAPVTSEPIGPYAKTSEGRLYHLGQNGPIAYQPEFTFRTFWPGRPMCGADLAGKGYCWNVNFDGYMGVGWSQSTGPWPQAPLGILSDEKFVQFVRGESMCGLTEAGVAYCWGPNRNRGAGVGTATPQASGCYGPCILVPTATATAARFTVLAGGGSGSPFGGGVVCGLTASSQLYCWSARLTADGSPVQVSGRAFTRIESGNAICGVEASGDAYCLQPGAGGTSSYDFTKVPLPFPVARIITGVDVSCALSAANGKLYCWGNGALGGGEPATAMAQNPVEVWGQR
jgi:hypothetical protein